MDDRRDDVDTWLQARIDPLPPPPGTFELIKRRARRRKMRQALVTATAAAAVVAAIIVVPHITTSLTITPNHGSAAANGSAASPATHGALSGSAVPNRTSTAGSGTGQGQGTAPVPADFAATSVTFVGLHTGWVIGQAGLPGNACATQYCTSLARTDNAGNSWSGVHAPVTGPPNGSSGVSQVRFLNTSFGWAFGPALWATQDGGQTWTQVPTGGQRVTDLETVGDRAFAVFATCTGSGSAFAAQCTSFSLYSATAGSNDWSPVSGPVTGLGNGGQAASASLVLTSTRGYLLSPGGTLYAGPVNGSGPWQQTSIAATGRNPCGALGSAQANGQPSTAMLAAASSSSLVLACTGQGSGTQIYTSANGGQTWQQQGSVPGSGTTTSLAAQPGGEIIVATTDGIVVSHDGGNSWQESAQAPSGPSGGFSYVGMTSPEQGVAVPANSSEHAIWFTFNGGLTWQSSPIKG
jgi:hypothetical protein